MRDLWEDDSIEDDEKSAFQYAINLKNKLQDCAKLIVENADTSSARYKSYFDLKSQDRQFNPGDEFLVLLPNNTSKFLMFWGVGTSKLGYLPD